MAKMIRCSSVLAGLLVALFPATVWSSPQCWLADQDTGELSFSGLTEGRGFEGEFEAFSVRICLTDQDLPTANIEVNVDTASADTQSRDRDQTLRGEEFFWVSQFPTATWTSGEIGPIDGAFSHQAQGVLALKDVRMSQPVDMRLVDEAQGLRLVGQALMLRLDYNVGTGEFEDTDFIANEVNVSFDLGLEREAES